MSTFRVCFPDKGGKSHQQLLKPGRLYAERVCFNQFDICLFLLYVLITTANEAYVYV